jgi:hypothetical protein
MLMDTKHEPSTALDCRHDLGKIMRNPNPLGDFKFFLNKFSCDFPDDQRLILRLSRFETSDFSVGLGFAAVM